MQTVSKTVIVQNTTQWFKAKITMTAVAINAGAIPAQDSQINILKSSTPQGPNSQKQGTAGGAKLTQNQTGQQQSAHKESSTQTSQSQTQKGTGQSANQSVGQQKIQKIKKGRNPNQGQPTIIKGQYKDLWAEKRGHIFSDDHIDNGIMKLGNSEDDILNKFKQVIAEANANGILVEGDNQIHTLINGQKATVRTHIKDGIQYSVDGFIGYFNPILGKLIEWKIK